MNRLFQLLSGWLYRFNDKTAPIMLDRRRIYILPTRGGLLYAAMLLAMWLGAINYNLSLGHTLVFLLFGLSMSGMLHGFRNLLGLTITLGRAEAVFAGETAHFPLLFAEYQRRSRRSLQIFLRQAPMESFAFELEADDRKVVDFPLAALKRGRCTLPALRLETRFPLGLFVCWSVLRPEADCLVYPKPLF